MKKKVLITLIVLILCIAGSFLTYGYFTKDEPTHKDEGEEIKEELKGTFRESLPRLDASLATQPLMDAFVTYFGGEDKLESVKENYTNTHPGYVKLIDGETDLIIVTEPSEEELKLASDKGVELVVEKIVNESFVFFVNSKNEVDNLTLEQVVDIYSGKITNWSEVGGREAPIIAYQRPTNSGSQTGMLSLVMKDTPMKKPTTEEAVETMGGIIDIVADFDNNIDGIGYSYYYYANTMYYTPNIKFLSIEGIEPTYMTTQDETYPIKTAYYIVTRSDADENIIKFKEALLSKEGAKVAQEAGYVPKN